LDGGLGADHRLTPAATPAVGDLIEDSFDG
jgi:hypothetical protein